MILEHEKWSKTVAHIAVDTALAQLLGCHYVFAFAVKVSGLLLNFAFVKFSSFELQKIVQCEQKQIINSIQLQVFCFYIIS